MDITVEELAIESFYPADQLTADALTEAAAASGACAAPGFSAGR